MDQPEWEPIYREILADMGYDRSSDEACVRILKAVTLGSDLVDDDEAASFFGETATVFGDAPCLESDIASLPPEGTLVASGSSVRRLLALGIRPDVVVTDLDGDIDSQLSASSDGALAFIHAHGDNQELVRGYAGRFRGPVVLTTQSAPENTVSDYGGFTDGDRAVCICQHFGAKRILLEGFDFEHPNPKDGSDPEAKRRKLAWARRILEMLSDRVVFVYPKHRRPLFYRRSI